jgi:hypothetical protein
MAKNPYNFAFRKVRSDVNLSSQKVDMFGKKKTYGNPDQGWFKKDAIDVNMFLPLI